MIKEAIVLAGGFGTRLSAVVNDVPKPMASVNGKPFLHYILQQISKTEIKKVVVAVHHKKEVIFDYLGKEYLGLEIEYSVEEEALGTGGGIRLALESCNGKDVLIMNGDSLLDVNLSEFIEEHNFSGTDHSMVLKEMQDVSRYGAVEVNSSNKVTSFVEKGSRVGSGYINSGIYILNREVFNHSTNEGKFSLETDFLEPLSKKAEIHAKISANYFIDIGIPQDFERAQDEFKRFENR